MWGRNIWTSLLKGPNGKWGFRWVVDLLRVRFGEGVPPPFRRPTMQSARLISNWQVSLKQTETPLCYIIRLFLIQGDVQTNGEACRFSVGAHPSFSEGAIFQWRHSGLTECHCFTAGRSMHCRTGRTADDRAQQRIFLVNGMHTFAAPPQPSGVPNALPAAS